MTKRTRLGALIDDFLVTFEYEVSPMRLILGFLFGASIAAGVLTACKSAVVPDAIDAGVCIVKDAVAGASVADIAKDCGALVSEVLVDVLSSKDPAVYASAAGAEARTIKASVLASNLCEGTVIPFDAGVYEGGGK